MEEAEIILKNILGAGVRGLLDYLSQPEKSTTTDHKNVQRIPDLHQPYLALHQRTRHAKPAAGFSGLPTLPGRGLDVDHGRRALLLQGDAPDDLVARRNVTPESMRRAVDKPGGDGKEVGGGAVAPFMTNLAGRTPREMSKEIGVLRRLRPNLKKAVSHLVLSHDPTQRKLTEKEWEEAVRIALHTHGANQAGFAAWRHTDTDHDHVHIFFCRVLPDGQVVSDSHNYIKNETAARQIERTLMLDAPTSTPDDDRPGDRQASYSAKRRATRLGEADPTGIRPQAVRQVLAQAQDRDHFIKLLADLKIEAEFDRRGAAQEIYGWRLRPAGTATWLKASSLAKDLSWPKISHRFMQTAEQPSPAMLAAPVELAPRTAGSYDRAPAMVRRSLQNNFPQNGVRSLGSSPDVFEPRKPLLDLQKLQGVDAGPLSKSLLILGGALINFSAEVILKIVEFVRRLLQKLGIGVRPSALQTYEHPSKVPLVYEPVVTGTDAAALPNGGKDVDGAAQKVLDVVESIGQKNTDLLPAGEGRAELAAALQKEFLTAGAAGSSDPFADMFANAPEPVQVDASAAPGASAFAEFKTALEALKTADAAVKKAGSNDSPDLPIYFDARPERNAERDQAARNHRQIQLQYDDWKSKNRVAAGLGLDPLGLKKELADAFVVLQHHRAQAAAAAKKDDEYTALVRRTPTAAVPVPPQIMAERGTAIAAARLAKMRLDEKISSVIEPLRINSMLAPKLAQVASDLKSLDRRFDRFLTDPAADINFSVEFEDVLQQVRQLKLAEDRRNGAHQVNADIDDAASFDGPRG